MKKFIVLVLVLAAGVAPAKKLTVPPGVSVPVVSSVEVETVVTGFRVDVLKIYPENETGIFIAAKCSLLAGDQVAKVQAVTMTKAEAAAAMGADQFAETFGAIEAAFETLVGSMLATQNGGE